MKRCFFIGHRETDLSILPLLQNAVEYHIIQHRVKEFFVGGYGNFDRMAAETVIKAKTCHPDISLFLLLPYHPAERPVTLPKGFDQTFYPENMEKIPRRLAIIHANRYMVNYADYLIAYVQHSPSNARNLLDYAKHKPIAVVNLATMSPL